jgi:transposase-like protein
MDVQYTSLSPIAGDDYPRYWNQFLEWFGTDEACQSYLEKLRWPAGFVCPRCRQAGTAYRASRTRLMCPNCKYQGTVTAGTVFDKTRIPLRTWLAAVWYITNQKQGVSALGLQRVLGLGSYETAWTMLHRLRRAMVRHGREQLKGIVEVDETFLSITGRNTPPSGVRVRGNTIKVLMVIAVEILQPKGFGRVRMRRVAGKGARDLVPFVQDSVAVGTDVRTDGSAAYLPLRDLGYDLDQTVILGSGVPAHNPLPGVHRVAALVKRWILGTHHGAIQPEQLDAYLDEFTFRFNRRTSRSRGMLFYRLLQQALATGPVTYDDVTRKASHARKSAKWS